MTPDRVLLAALIMGGIMSRPSGETLDEVAETALAAIDALIAKAAPEPVPAIVREKRVPTINFDDEDP